MHVDIQSLSKRYANGVLACDAVSLQLQPGEVHAILGENGAGKSSLMKMLYGLVEPDSGSIVVQGQPRRFDSPLDAMAAGIGLVPQHLQLLPSLTVAENLVLGAEPVRGPLFDARRARAAASQAAAAHGLAIDVDAAVGTLSAGQQQRVAILKALHRGARLLLLDEPTALLAPAEAEALFEHLRTLVAGGASVVLISHKMAEVQQAADRYTVLRAGRVVGGGRAAGLSAEHLATLMMGRPLAPLRSTRVDARGRPPLLAVRELTLLRPGARPDLAALSLDVAGGEILGIAGVEGNGQQPLAEVLGGLREASSGSLQLAGRTLAGLSVRQRRQAGLGSVSEDRLHDGIAPALSVAENAVALDYNRPPQSRRGVLDVAHIARRARDWVARYGVVCRDERQATGALSGGNMQKVVLARELEAAPRCLVASQPTRGVDIGAARALRAELLALRDRGAAVLLFSADLDELLALADRIAVLFEGRIVGHFAADSVAPRMLGRYMTGSLQDRLAQARLDAPFTAPFTAMEAP